MKNHEVVYSRQPVFVFAVSIFKNISFFVMLLFLFIGFSDFPAHLSVVLGMITKPLASVFIFMLAILANSFYFHTLYNNTQYNFYSDFLEYKREFFVFDQKIIQYQDIIQCTLHRNLIQKEYDLYTIKLATANTEAEIQNIKEAEEVYQFIKANMKKDVG